MGALSGFPGRSAAAPTSTSVVVVVVVSGVVVVVVVVVLVVVGGSVVVVVLVVVGGSAIRGVVGGSAGVVGCGGGSDATIEVVVVWSGVVVPERVGSVVDPPPAIDVVVDLGVEPIDVVDPSLDCGVVDDTLDSTAEVALADESVVVTGAVVVVRSISTVNGSLRRPPHEDSTAISATAVRGTAPPIRIDCTMPSSASRQLLLDDQGCQE